ncbi:ATP-dependent helicase [Candidatus Woesearchaeota archaeon]|nr:ATP-dependent helicase [Candidatus Woesearchaeota archaeon]
MTIQKTKPNKSEEIEHILHPIVKSWFFSKFKEFSLPQLYSILEVHSRKNILVSASTGSGKTLTAFLAILNELIDSSQKGILENKVYCIYISPLKALSNDVQINLKEPLKEMEEQSGNRFGIRIAVRTGDTTQAEKADMLKKPPHILITTPESAAILLSSYRFCEYLKNVDFCIIDEIHALAENKRGVHLSLSLERLQTLSPAMTRVGLSATISPLDEIAKFLVGYEKEKLRDCIVVDVPFLKELDLSVMSPVKDIMDTVYGHMHNEMYSIMDKMIQQHRTTLIFTNTRSATERVVHFLKTRFPKNYTENIGAHHGSLSKEHRLELEKRMREGKLKVVVSSTSLELGIDIGYIDLVILLGSPKSVARTKQRLGRSGHKLHAKIYGKILVLDRDDLVECSLIAKDVIEHRIDNIHIPTNCLDVLAQQIFGIAISGQVHINELYGMIKGSYCYHELNRVDFDEIIDYLSGRYISLEDRHIYARIWHDEETKMIGKKGKLARVLYMTNIGTIPDESHVKVKVGNLVIGMIDEGFLERLNKGDVFVLGGNVYEFKHAKGMTAFVNATVNKQPNVPSWFSDVLPLSFGLAMDIQRFRKLVNGYFKEKKTKEEIKRFIKDYLYAEENSVEAMYNYFYEQYNYLEIPHYGKMVIEHYSENNMKYSVFHSLYGRRVNDVLSRAVAFAIAKVEHVDVEIGINDNGFYVASEKNVNVVKALKSLKSKELRDVVSLAIDQTEILKRRFRHCATRALMILRSYKGMTKNVGVQQMSSALLLNAVRRISNDFPILREARREILEDLMDVENAVDVLRKIEGNEIEIKEFITLIPSPFAFNIVMQGHLDVLKADDKIEFLKRMHRQVLAKIALKKKQQN